MKKWLTCFALTFMAYGMAHAQLEDVKTVASVDIGRYIGTWHEIARFPNRFQTKCVSDVTAEYRKCEDGNIDVINRCRKSDGTYEQANGYARVADAASNAKLKVRFAPEWLAWLPTVWGDYWIIALAPDYSYAVVGDPGRKYLWILARTTDMPEETYQTVVRQARDQGYDVIRLVRTEGTQRNGTPADQEKRK